MVRKRVTKRNFGTAEGYRKWNAFRFIHNVDKGAPYESIYIGGKKHSVEHGKARSHRKSEHAEHGTHENIFDVSKYTEGYGY